MNKFFILTFFLVFISLSLISATTIGQQPVGDAVTIDASIDFPPTSGEGGGGGVPSSIPDIYVLTTGDTMSGGLTITSGGLSVVPCITLNGIQICDWGEINSTSAGDVSGTGIDTQIAYWNESSNLEGDDDFVWNNTNKFLGIGTNTPTAGVFSEFIKIVPSGNNVYAIKIDQDSTNTWGAGGFTIDVKTANAASDDEINAIGFNVAAENNHEIDSTTADINHRTKGYSATAYSNAPHSATDGDRITDRIEGATMSTTRIGTVTASKMTQYNNGIFLNAGHAINYNSAGGTLTTENYGINSRVIDTSTTTAGTQNTINTGIWAAIISNAGSTTTKNYAAYISSPTNGDENWNLYCESAAHSYMGYDNAKTYWGSAKDSSTTYNGSDQVNNAREAGTGYQYFQTEVYVNETELVCTNENGACAGGGGGAGKAGDLIFLWNDTTTMYFNDTRLNNTIDQKLQSIIYYAENVTVPAGTWVAGNTTDLWAAQEGFVVNVTEAGGVAPVLTIIVNYTGVVDFNSLIGRWQYLGGLGHEISIGIWDYGSRVFEEEYGEITDMDTMSFVNIPILDAANHINAGGDVSIRFYHQQNGNINHEFYLDYLVLVDGFSTITTYDHDALSNRDDITNHPWAFATSGERAMSGNISALGFNISMDSFFAGVSGEIRGDLLVDGAVNITQNLTVQGRGEFFGDVNKTLLVGAGNVRVGNYYDSGGEWGTVLFETELTGLGGANTIWAIDNGGGNLRFYNPLTSDVSMRATSYGWQIGDTTHIKNFTVSGSASIEHNLSIDVDTLFVDSDLEKVCIGCEDPVVALDVRGDINASNLTVSGIAFYNSNTFYHSTAIQYTVQAADVAAGTATFAYTPYGTIINMHGMNIGLTTGIWSADDWTTGAPACDIGVSWNSVAGTMTITDQTACWVAGDITVISIDFLTP